MITIKAGQDNSLAARRLSAGGGTVITYEPMNDGSLTLPNRFCWKVTYRNGMVLRREKVLKRVTK